MLLILVTADERPNIIYLNRLKSGVCGARNNAEIWRDLGIELLGQEGEADLNTISASHGGNITECCSRMFSLWLERQPDASWKQLIVSLTKVNLVSLATIIESQLLIPPAEQQQQASQQTQTDPRGM